MPEARRVVARLRVTTPPDMAGAHELYEPTDVVVVGRGQGASWALGHHDLSREHARFEWTGGALLVEDLSSLNGTAVNGSPIPPSKPVRVVDGDRVQVGPLRLAVEIVESRAPRPVHPPATPCSIAAPPGNTHVDHGFGPSPIVAFRYRPASGSATPEADTVPWRAGPWFRLKLLARQHRPFALAAGALLVASLALLGPSSPSAPPTAPRGVPRSLPTAELSTQAPGATADPVPLLPPAVVALPTDQIERLAVSALAEGQTEAARALYGELHTRQPEHRAFAALVRILGRKGGAP